jgi:trehalose 6-phosphate synthase
MASRHDGRPFAVESPDGTEYRVKLVASEVRTPTTASTTSSRTRCCGSSSTTCGDLSNAPDIRPHEDRGVEFGYNVVNEGPGAAVLRRDHDRTSRSSMVHDYHLYTLPAAGAARGLARLRSCTTSSTSRGPQPDAWRRAPARIRTRSTTGLLSNDIIGSTPRATGRQLPAVLPDLMGWTSTSTAAWCAGRTCDVWVRAYPLPIDVRADPRRESRAPGRASSSRSSSAAGAST